MTVGKVNHLTPQREAMNLYRHSTMKWNLMPNAVYQTAVRDFQSLEFNTWLRGERAEIEEKHGKKSVQYKALPKIRRFGFLAEHIRKGRTPTGLLKTALEDRDEGIARAKNVNTLALYDNASALAQAYALAVAAEKVTS
ncbi:hypothetical protein LCGC14_0960930 [marine sediment metagenome]|uniref:Uncharacterized protein n=1 Tax=marine sediment metagenome TaxID=412755 RepID=A0A0F9P0Q1_9ZZZZ